MSWDACEGGEVLDENECPEQPILKIIVWTQEGTFVDYTLCKAHIKVAKLFISLLEEEKKNE